MKTIVKTKRNIPVIAYVSHNQLSLNLFYEGDYHLISQDHLRSDNSYQIDSNLVNELRNFSKQNKKPKMVLVLSGDLILYSEQKFPLGLTQQEIEELFQMHLARRKVGSEIDTYYDYFPLKEYADSVLFGLFEARKDMLLALIGVFENCGFRVSITVPQLLIVINHVMQANNSTEKNYQIICFFPRQIFIAQIVNNKLIGLHQTLVAQKCNDENDYSSIYVELKAQLIELDCERIITIGLKSADFESHMTDTKTRVSCFKSLVSEADLVSTIIIWMREQYDLHKFVAMA